MRRASSTAGARVTYPEDSSRAIVRTIVEGSFPTTTARSPTLVPGRVPIERMVAAAVSPRFRDAWTSLASSSLSATVSAPRRLAVERRSDFICK